MKIHKMKPALAEEIQRLRRRIAKAAIIDTMVRYDIGTVVKKVRGNRAKYGEQALKQLERAFDFDENTLRRFEAVAETWTGAALGKLLGRKNAKALPLTWSHLELLAEVKSDARREKLIEKAITLALSVRALALEVHPHRAATNEPMGDDPQSRCVQMRQVTRRVVEMAKSVVQLDPLLDVEDVAAVPEYQGAVQEAAQAYSALRSACDEAIAKLEGKLKPTLPPAAKPVAV